MPWTPAIALDDVDTDDVIRWDHGGRTLCPAELKHLEQMLLWLSAWMIHDANHLRPKADGEKVGGHQASCALWVTLMTALYAAILRPVDRVAVILAVTSADRLNAGWQVARTARIKGRDGQAHIETLLSGVARDVVIVTVIDGPSATLSWLGSDHGHRGTGRGVEHFRQTGTVADLYRHSGIDRNPILKVLAGLKKGRPLRAAGGAGGE